MSTWNGNDKSSFPQQKTTTQCMPKMLTWKFNDDIRLFILCVYESIRDQQWHTFPWHLIPSYFMNDMLYIDDEKNMIWESGRSGKLAKKKSIQKLNCWLLIFHQKIHRSKCAVFWCDV